MSRLRLVVAVAAALVLAMPGVASAATYEIGGTLRNADGSAAAGIEVTALVVGADQVVAATTDEAGAWSLSVDADPGALVEVGASGTPVQSEPDADGCVTTTVPSARAEITLDEGPVAPVELTLEDTVMGQVCSATATPDGTGSSGGAASGDISPDPGTSADAGGTGSEVPAEGGAASADALGPTPPSTDVLGRVVDSPGTGLPALLAVLFGGSAVVLLHAATARPRR